MSADAAPLTVTAWTQAFASTLRRLYPATDPADAMGIAHGRFFVDEGLDPVQAAELYALSEGNPIQRSGLGQKTRTTFRGLTERLMNSAPGLEAFKQMARDANELSDVDPRNEDIYAGARAIATWYVQRFQAEPSADSAVRSAHEKALRACYRLLIALSADPVLRARTLKEALNDCCR